MFQSPRVGGISGEKYMRLSFENQLLLGGGKSLANLSLPIMCPRVPSQQPLRVGAGIRKTDAILVDAALEPLRVE